MPLSFSLEWLLAVVAFVAYACAAMVYVTPEWATTTFSLAILFLLLGTVALCTCPRETRAFWTGFTVFGWAYFALPFAPWFSSERSNLLTHDLINFIHGKLDPWRAIRSAESGFQVTFEAEGRIIHTGPRRIWYVWQEGTYHCSHRIGNALFTVIFAGVGGLVGRCFARTRDVKSSAPD